MTSLVWDVWMKMTAVGTAAAVVATDCSVETLSAPESVKMVAINVLKTSGASLAGAAAGLAVGYLGGRYIARMVNSVTGQDGLPEKGGEFFGAFFGFYGGSLAGMGYVINQIANSSHTPQ